MPPFDIRTAFLFIGLLYLLLPIVTWIVLVEQRSQQVALWCGGGILLGVATILVGQTGLLPAWATISIPALLLNISQLARIQSLRMDLGMPWRMRWIALFVLAISLIVNFIQFGLGKPVLRAQFNFTVAAALFLYLALLAWRIGRLEQSPSALWIARVYGVVIVAMLFRIISLQEGGSTDFVNEGITVQLLSLALLLSAVVGHLGYVGLALDRSRRRELKATADLARDEESHRLGAQIAHLDRQRSLGEMSASLGHELNQPLTAILTNAQIASRALQGGRLDAQQHSEILNKVIHNTQRASQIIERIRGFIRPSAVSLAPVNLNLIALDVAELVGDEARSYKISFMFPSAMELVMVRGDSVQLSQIILNVFRNAIEALKQVERREIHVTCTIESGIAIMRIRDTGPGLTPEVQAQVGTAFFTTRPDGLGLGFSISRSIATQLGGSLNIRNADDSDGGGAVVELSLPAILQPQQQPQSQT